MSLRTDRLLDMLSDGKWHHIDQVSQALELGDSEVQKIAGFLSQFNFVEFDEKTGRVKMTVDFQKIVVSDAT